MPMPVLPEEWRAKKRFIIVALVLVAAGVPAWSFLFGLSSDDLVPGLLFLVLSVALVISVVLPLASALYLGAAPFAAAARGRRARFLPGLLMVLFIALIGVLPFWLVPLETADRTPDAFWWTLAWLGVPAVFYAAAALAGRFCRRTAPAIFLVLGILLAPLNFLPVFALFTLVLLPLFSVLLLFLPVPGQALFLLFSAIILVSLFSCAWLARRKAAHGPGAVRRAVFAFVVGLALFSLAAHGMARLATGRHLARALRDARAAGLATAPAEIALPAAPGEATAAALYGRAFESAENLEKTISREWHDQPFLYLPFARRETAGALALLESPEFIEFFALVDEAATRPPGRFDINWEDAPYFYLRHLGPLRSLSRLVALRTHIFFLRGEHESALASARTGFRLAGSLEGEPLTVSQMARFSIAVIAADACRALLDSAPGEVPSAVYREILGEAGRLERSMAAGAHGEPAIFPANPWPLIARWRAEFRIPPLHRLDPRPCLARFLFEPHWRRARAIHARETVVFARLAGEPWFEARSELDRRADLPGRWYEDMYTLVSFFEVLAGVGGGVVLADRTFPWYRRPLESRARSLASLDSFRLALAARIYREERGRWPAAFSDLAPGILAEIPADPFTGEDFVHRFSDGGFAVYSVGPNLADDGGVREPGSGLDDIGWTVDFPPGPGAPGD